MLNLCLNPNLRTNKVVSRKEAANFNVKFNTPLNKDTICFTGNYSSVKVDTEYKNVLQKPLVSKERASFEQDLKAKRPICFDAAKVRISSLSRYLKEDMVGFVVPEYNLKGDKKGGYQWFEKGAEYLLKGTKIGVEEKDFKPAAKELYGLLALHDDYWKSPEFVEYLSSLEQTPAIKATIDAVEELGWAKNISFTGEETISSSGYFSPLKYIGKLLDDGCAYSGKHFSKNDYKNRPSLEHIMPECWGGPCEDYNYLLTSADANYARGNMGLIKYLKGGGAKKADPFAETL